MKKLFFGLSLVLLAACLLFCASCDKKPVDGTTQNISINNDKSDSNNVDESAGTETITQDQVSFENKEFLGAVKKALGKEFLSEQDILDIYYLAIVPVADGKYGLSVGLSDYRDAYFAEVSKEAPNPANLVSYVKESEFTLEGTLDSDLALFKNIEIFEYYSFSIKDVTFIKSYQSLVYGYFYSNGITDISGLSDYNPERLLELDFTGNEISDWSALSGIEDKVIVLYSAESGKTVTLKEFNSSSDKEALLESVPAEEEGTTQAPMTEEEAKKQAEAITQQIAESLDLSELFE